MRNLTCTLATSGVALLAVLGGSAANAAPPVYNWTGFYIGANAGYGWGNTSVKDEESFNIKTHGWMAGLHTGYNWQFGSLVMGPEFDIGLSGVRGKDPFFDDKDIHVNQRWNGSARLRVGLPVDGLGPNGMMFYGTGGLAVAGWRSKIDDIDKDSRTHFGWTVGGGIEMPFGSSVTGRIEYIYSDYGAKKYFDGAKLDPNLNAVRFGISYRFAPPPP
jgi:outer membrane immunogenic protein